MAEKGGKYLNPEKKQVYEALMNKTDELSVAIEAGDTAKMTALAEEVKTLRAELNSTRSRRSTLDMSPADALATELAPNEAIIIVRTVKGAQVSKSVLNPEAKNHRVSAGIDGLWPFEAK
jgi:hypothetical protein